METVYLANGQVCYLNGQIGDKFIVRKVYEYEDAEVGFIEVEDLNDIVVDAIYRTRPIEKIEADVARLTAKRDEVVKEVYEASQRNKQLEYEAQRLTKTQVEQQKFIINKNDILNAKTLVMFPKDTVMPITMTSDSKDFKGLKISFEISWRYGIEEKVWGYKLYESDTFGSGQFLCPKYGLLLDPTQEQVDEIIKKRLADCEFRDYVIAAVDDTYLSEAQIESKRSYILRDQALAKERAENELKAAQKRLADCEAAIAKYQQPA